MLTRAHEREFGTIDGKLSTFLLNVSWYIYTFWLFIKIFTV